MEIDGFRGQLITAEHTDYHTARAVWNGAIDRRPRLIARCSPRNDRQRCAPSSRSAALDQHRNARTVPPPRFLLDEHALVPTVAIRAPPSEYSGQGWLAEGIT